MFAWRVGEAIRLNACELELDLLCRGMRIPLDVSLAGARGVARTRAGLGSGLEVVVPTGSRIKGEIWLNVPALEPFASDSPYRLQGGPDGAIALSTTAAAAGARVP